MEFSRGSSAHVVTLGNVVDSLRVGGVITRERIYHPQKWRTYRLLNDVAFELTNGATILIRAGFQWDLSSTPRFLWPVLPPDGDFEAAALIHDFLYQNKFFGRRFADCEMFIWSKATNPRLSVDNLLRFVGVRLFGWIVWNKPKRVNTLH